MVMVELLAYGASGQAEAERKFEEVLVVNNRGVGQLGNHSDIEFAALRIPAVDIDQGFQQHTGYDKVVVQTSSKPFGEKPLVVRSASYKVHCLRGRNEELEKKTDISLLQQSGNEEGVLKTRSADGFEVPRLVF